MGETAEIMSGDGALLFADFSIVFLLRRLRNNGGVTGATRKARLRDGPVID